MILFQMSNDDGPNATRPAVAFETSADFGAVAVGRGPQILEARRLSGPRRHAAEFVPVLAALCRAHDIAPGRIAHVYLSVGPGSFTGLRIGVATARMISFAWGARIVAVPTLEAVAQNAATLDDPPQRVAVILDAKRGNVYAAEFERRGPDYVAASEAAEVSPARFFAARPAGTAVLGEGVPAHREVLGACGVRVLPDHCHPADVQTVYRLGYARAIRGEFVEARSLVPLYVRPPEAEEKWLRRTGGGQ